MKIKSMHVKNFRSILDVDLCFSDLTALIGTNGSGKSSFLYALELFEKKEKQSAVSIEDFYNENITEPITISITFNALTDHDKKIFSKYIKTNELTIDKIFKFDNESKKIKQSWHGYVLQNKDFSEIHNSDNAEIVKTKYSELHKKNEEYQNLPKCKSMKDTKKNLVEWEDKHPDKCEKILSNEEFFSSNKLEVDNLQEHIKFLYIPTVKDIKLDATDEGKNSTLTELIDLVIRNELMQNKDIEKLKTKILKKSQKILDDKKMRELSNELTQTLNNYIPDAEINISWKSPNLFKIEDPEAKANLTEDGYKTDVERVGHGLQRAFMITMLQYFRTQQSKNLDLKHASNNPVFVLIIEEPELFQHPSRQRHFFWKHYKIYLNMIMAMICINFKLFIVHIRLIL